jgi:hypothetical protein
VNGLDIGELADLVLLDPGEEMTTAAASGSPSRSAAAVSTTRNCRGCYRKPPSPNCAWRSR